jgi:hypothetical protein
MREVLSIHLGHAGIQLSEFTWELFCLENSISPVDGEFLVPPNLLPNPQEPQHFTSFFQETEQNIYKSRAIFADVDCATMNMAKHMPMREIH